MKRAVIYTRVSTDEQNENGLQRQIAKITKYCEKSELEIAARFHDNHSAKNFKRPQWEVLLEAIENNKIKTDLIVVTEINRFSRNTFETHNMIKILGKYNIKVYSVTENQFLTAGYESYKTQS